MLATLRSGALIVLATAAASVATGGRAVADEVERRPGFVVIVHPSNPVTRVSAKFLAEAFLKKRTQWPSKKVIAPVDLGPRSPLRRQFSEGILDRSLVAVRSYWSRIVFSGRGVPPLELGKEQDVIAYVRKHPGAIGYVSAQRPVVGVKVVTVTR